MVDVPKLYKVNLEGTKDSVAAAILTLAETIQQDGVRVEVDVDYELGHQICLGIRKGLFGADADDNENVRGVLNTDHPS